MKFLSECYRDKGLEAYGLKGYPRIKELLLNEFSRVRAIKGAQILYLKWKMVQF